MNESNTQKLYADFPRLYRNATVPYSCMTWGFACGDGWFDIVYKLSADIEAEARAQGLDPASNVWPAALQVKEKFGTLNFYVGIPKDDDESEDSFAVEQHGQVLSIHPVPNIASIRELVSKAADRSATTCQRCGQPAKLIREGYWRTLCDQCEAAHHGN